MMHDMKMKFIATDVKEHKFVVFAPEEWMQKNWVVGNYYEETMLNYIKDNYKGGTFVDAGACMGNHSIFFSTIADDVVSFEPLKENFYHFTLNLKLNNIKNVDSYNFGLSDKADLKILWYDDKYETNGSSTMEVPTQDTKNIRYVPVVPLDALEINDVKLIKIDVEGHEMGVLRGAKKTIEMFKPDMFIECSTTTKFDEVWTFLEPFGYVRPNIVFNGTPTYLFSIEKKEVPENAVETLV